MDSLPPQLVSSLLWQSPQIQQHPLSLQQLAQPQQNQSQYQQQVDAAAAAAHVASQLLSGAGVGSSLPMNDEHTAGSIVPPTLPGTVPAAQFVPAPSGSLHNINLSIVNPDLQTAAATPPGLLVAIPKDMDGHNPHRDGASDTQPNSAMDTDETSSQSGAATGEGSHSPEPNGDGQGKKRHRLRPEQTRRLMEVFEKTTKPDSEMRKALGKQLGMTPRTVQIWFQNRRAKLKRESNAPDPLRMPGFFGSGMYANRGRLTYNRAYMGRRQIGRVASEGFENLRGIQGFEPYPHEAFRGLPLQNPSQISIPADIPLQFTLQSIHGGPHVVSQSAIGVPAGQGPSSSGVASAVASSGPSAPAVGQMLSAALPAGSALHHNHHPAHPTPHHALSGTAVSGTPPAPLVSTRGYIQPVALQLQAQSGHDAARGRIRSFTADSHTLANIGRAVHPQSSVDAGGGGGGGMASQDMDIASGLPMSSQQQLSHPHPPPHPPPPPTDVPSAGALLESRRRHLQDLMIINQTHAARGISTSSMPSGRGGIPSDTLPDGSNMCGPLLLSELAQSSPLATSAILPAPSIPAPGIAAASSGPLPSEAAAASVVAASTAAAPTAAATSTPVPCRYLSGNAAAPTHAAATSSSSALANHAALLGSSSVATAVIQGYAGEVDSGNANGGSRGVGACDSFERPLYVSEVSLDDGEQGPISYNDAMTVAATTSASPPSVLAPHDRHAAEQQQQHQQPSADQSAVPMLPLGCGTDDAASGQYQLLNDLLMQCSALDFLNGTAGFGQALQNGGIQPDSHSSLHADLAGLDRQLERQHAEAQSPTILPQLPSSSLETEVSGLSHGLGDISATSSKFAESLFSDNTALANAVAAAYLSANSASDISSSDGSTAAAGSSNSPSTSMGVSQADSSAASAASFLVASTEPMATPLHTAAHDPAGHLSFHASLSELGMLQSKPSRNPVSVASSELPGQRDVMIEQITYPTMPF